MESRSGLRLLLTGADYFLRLLFFIAVPFVLVWFAALFSLTGALINIGLMLAVFAGRELVRSKAERYPILKRVLRRHLRFEAYYRERPPRPFIYYMVYPLLFPYWLINREARREFLLYKGYTVVSLIVLVATSTYQYFHLWRPELGFGVFLRSAWGNFVIETVVVLTFLLPIATTVVSFTLEKKKKRLYALLTLACLAAGIGGIALHMAARKHHAVVPLMTQTRLLLRTAAAPTRARDAIYKALRAAEASPDLLKTIGKHGRVEGDALEAAHDQLEAFYKEDEAHAFSVAVYPAEHPRLIILFFWIKRAHKPIWLAIDAHGRLITPPKDGTLPPDLVDAMKELSPP